MAARGQRPLPATLLPMLHALRLCRNKHRELPDAAAPMGIDQPKVSALLDGHLARFCSDRPMRLLTALGQDVWIDVQARPRSRSLVHICALSEART